MGNVLRVFEVKAKIGCEKVLKDKLSTTSIDVVRDKPGNKGFYVGEGIDKDDRILVFTSIWEDIDSIKRNFGADWKSAYLPPGYKALIDTCSIKHFLLI